MQLSELSEERCKTNEVLGDLHRDFKHLEALNRPHMLFTRRNPVIMTYNAPFQSLEGFSYCIRNSCTSSKTFESCMSEFGIAWIVMPSLCCFQRENPPRLVYKDESTAVSAAFSQLCQSPAFSKLGHLSVMVCLDLSVLENL